MTKHEFGGDWTTDKLERVRKYLSAYTTIFTRNPRARYYRTIYVDAFAGTGHRSERGADVLEADMFEEAPDADRDALKKGSARIALEVEPAFDQYLFIEQAAGRIDDLKELVRQFPEKSNAVRIERADANEFLARWCMQTDWRKHRGVVFLDPYGMQVEWAMLEAIANTKAIDLWLLFPLGVAVNRLLTRDSPPPQQWANALTRIFGVDDWRTVFYAGRDESTLFGTEPVQRRTVDYEGIGAFFCDRLRSVFARVAENPLPLRNSKGQPIYLLCFAAGNPKGAQTAVRIAQHILKP